MQRTLAQLLPGQAGFVRDILGERSIRHRLLEMGLTRGTSVQLVRVAPLGDPIEVELRGYRLSVRKSEASRVTLEGE